MTQLKKLTKTDLPREKLLRYGPTRLADHELLAIILGSGIKGKNVLVLAKSLISKVSRLGINNVALEDIVSIKGIGKVKALQVIAILELTKRLNRESPEILSDKDIYNLCSDITNSQREHLLAFYLNTQNQLIERQIISIGTLNASLIHPREVYEPALRLHAASVIIVHNHPSGSLIPSESDIEITDIIRQSGEIIGIPLHYHLIISIKGHSRVK